MSEQKEFICEERTSIQIVALTIRLYVCGWCVLMYSMNQLRICGKNTAVYSRFHRTLKTHSVNWHLEEYISIYNFFRTLTTPTDRVELFKFR